MSHVARVSPLVATQLVLEGLDQAGDVIVGLVGARPREEVPAGVAAHGEASRRVRLDCGGGQRSMGTSGRRVCGVRACVRVRAVRGSLLSAGLYLSPSRSQASDPSGRR